MVAFSELEWDEDKRQATLRERGVDIAYAALIFLDDVFTTLGHAPRLWRRGALSRSDL